MLHRLAQLKLQEVFNNLLLNYRKSCSYYKLLLLLIFPIIFLPLSGHSQKPKQTGEIAAFIKKQSLVMAKRASDWAKDKTSDILLDGVKEFIKKNKLDQNTAGKILTAVANNKGNLQQIYEGASTTDIQAAALSTQLLIGKIIAENVPQSNMSVMLKALTKYPDVAAEASQALGSIAGGDYYKGSETIGKIIWKQTAIGKGIDKAISLEKVGWDFLMQQQFDAAFQKYKENGSEGLIRMYSGPAAYIREKYFQGKSVSDDVINAKMVQLFETARKEEAAAQNEQVKLEHMYDMFKRMEIEGGLIFDFRKHQEQFGISKETDVFERFLWLNRAIRRDLLSTGVDPWVLGNTLNSDNPTLSPEALALFMAFSQGGAASYKAKFDEIARSHFPKKDEEKTAPDKVKLFVKVTAPCAVHTIGLPNYYIPESTGSAEMLLASKNKEAEQVEIRQHDFSFPMEFNETYMEPTGLYDATITGTFSADRMNIEQLTITYSFRKPSGSDKTDRKWSMVARNIPFKKESAEFIEYTVRYDNGMNKETNFSFAKTEYFYSLSEQRTTSSGITYSFSTRKDSFKIAEADVWISLQFYKSPTIPSLNVLKQEKN